MCLRSSPMCACQFLAAESVPPGGFSATRPAVSHPAMSSVNLYRRGTGQPVLQLRTAHHQTPSTHLDAQETPRSPRKYAFRPRGSRFRGITFLMPTQTMRNQLIRVQGPSCPLSDPAPERGVDTGSTPSPNARVIPDRTRRSRPHARKAG